MLTPIQQEPIPHYLYDPFIADCVKVDLMTPLQATIHNKFLIDNGEDLQWISSTEVPPWATLDIPFPK